MLTDEPITKTSKFRTCLPALLNLLCWLSNSCHEVFFSVSKITTSFHILGCQVEMGVFSVYLDLMTPDCSSYSLFIIFFLGSPFSLLLYGALSQRSYGHETILVKLYLFSNKNLF